MAERPKPFGFAQGEGVLSVANVWFNGAVLLNETVVFQAAGEEKLHSRISPVSTKWKTGKTEQSPTYINS